MMLCKFFHAFVILIITSFFSESQKKLIHKFFNHFERKRRDTSAAEKQEASFMGELIAKSRPKYLPFAKKYGAEIFDHILLHMIHEFELKHLPSDPKYDCFFVGLTKVDNF